MPHLVLIQLNNNMRFQSFELVISPTPRNLSAEFFFFHILKREIIIINMQNLVMWVKCDKYLDLIEFLKSHAYFLFAIT